MIGVSKTFGGSSILSSPATDKLEMSDLVISGFYFYKKGFNIMPIEKRGIIDGNL